METWMNFLLALYRVSKHPRLQMQCTEVLETCNTKTEGRSHKAGCVSELRFQGRANVNPGIVGFTPLATAQH